MKGCDEALLLGKVLSVVAASAALLEGSMKAALPDKNMEGEIFLINRQHSVSEYFVPETLRKVEATGMSQSMREDAAAALEEMFAAAKEEGINLSTVSGYRSYSKQATIYARKKASQGEEAETGIKFEPWHFRYVGKEIASYIMSRGITLEAFTQEAQAAIAEFESLGGDVEEQLAYEFSRLNAPPESYVLDELGEDGDAEVSLIF